jgi:hypothetical protein
MHFLRKRFGDKLEPQTVVALETEKVERPMCLTGLGRPPIVSFFHTPVFVVYVMFS